VFDLFFKDMDRSLREMGAGDLAVPKKVQKMGGIFYGLLNAIAEALDRGNADDLTAVLERNVFAGEAAPGARPLAEYLVAEAARLDAQPVEAITRGVLAMGQAA
jgi:cytochrome b pre-mRNA-processing protein 3